MSFKNIGNFLKAGTDIDKLGEVVKNIGDLTKAADALKSIDGLDDALKISVLRDNLSGVNEESARTALGITNLGNSMANTAKQTGGLGTALKGMFKANPISTIATVVTAAFGVFSMIKNAINQYKQGLIDQATEATTAWNDTTSSLEEYANKYQELRAQLDSGELSEAETVSVKEQILDIQNQITDQYGEQAAGIDLVNGKLEAQLGIIRGISQEEAEQNINENLNAYEDAEKEMLKNRHYYLGDTGEFVNVPGAGKQIYDLAEQLGFTTSNNTDIDGVYSIYLDTNAEEANEKINQFLTGLREIRSEYEDQDLDVPYAIENAIDYAEMALEDSQKILDDYRENYESYLEQQIYESGNGEMIANYADAIDEYNKALSEGDPTAIEDAKAAFEEAEDAKNDFLSSGDNAQFSRIFDDLDSQLSSTKIKIEEARSVLEGGDLEGSWASKLAESISGIDLGKELRDQFQEIKDLDLDAVDVEVALDTDGVQDGEDAIRKIAEILDFDLSSDEDVQALITLLTELGIVSDDTGVSISEIASNFDEFSASIQTAIDNVSQLQTIMGESTSGKGISGESLAAFREMFGDDAEKALERTANGYHLNEEALQELQQKQEQMVRSDYLSALSEQYDDLRIAETNLLKASMIGEDTSGYQAEIEQIQGNIQGLQDLQMEYQAATSAYQQWQNAMSDGNERDMYENIQGGYAQVTDLIERGWGGSEEVRTYVDLLSSADLSTASVEEVMDAYNRLGETIGNTGYRILDFFTVDEDGNSTTDGIYNFFDTVNAVLGDEFAKINENGDYEFNFLDGGDQKVAEQLGMDVEAVQSILRAAADAGFVVNLDQPIQSMEELKTSAQEAKDALSNMGDTELSNINLDASSYDEITNSIATVQEYIDKIDGSNLDLNVKEDKITEANNLLDYLVQRQSELNGSEINIEVNTEELQTQINNATAALEEFRNEDGTFNVSAEGYEETLNNLQTLLAAQETVNNNSVVMSIDTSQLSGNVQTAIDTIQQLETAIEELNVQNQLKSQGVDIDTSAASRKVSELAAQVQGLDQETKVTLGIDTESFDQSLSAIHGNVQVGATIFPSDLENIQNSIKGITGDALVKFGVDKTLVDSYTAENKDTTAKVKYTVDDFEVDTFLATDHDTTAELTYNVRVVGMGNIQRNITGTITYNATTSGTGSVNGTAHALGTVQDMKLGYYRSRGFNAHAMGDWALPAPETALVNELGTEGLIRDGNFSLIPGGAHLQNFKKGDIIFNHQQVKELLANGYVTSGGGHGRMIRVNGSAYNMLNAYSSGSGPSRRPSRPSYSMDEAYASSAKDYSNTATTAAKAASSISDAADAAEEFNEKIDWIEVLIDRVERAIDKLSKTAENSYELFTTRNNALSQQIQKTTEEINYQQQAYNRYIQEANSVGLSEDWAAKVRNGLIDIQEITDENLKEMVDEYQQWCISRPSIRQRVECIYLIAGNLSGRKGNQQRSPFIQCMSGYAQRSAAMSVAA